MKKITILFITIISAAISFAQPTSKVSGTLVDSISNEPVSEASISLRSEKDSSFKFFITSSSKGSFEFKNADTGNYLFTVSYQGLEIVEKTISIANKNSSVNLGIIKMKKAFKILEDVIVKDIIPIKLMDDTIAYRSDAYKTKPNATAEDLLKKLPGLQVDKNGNIKAQGEQVQKVYVDGKEFFSNDPNQATKNLTVDMIDQVQVYNERSEQSKFNGIDDGSRTKAINLKLKKNKTSGVFGKACGGSGTDYRYNAGAALNYFTGATQISLIAGTNNIGNSDYTGSGGGSRVSGGSIGIPRTSSFGVNYRDVWSKNFYVTGSYLYSHDNSTNLRKSAKQAFLTDSTLLSNRETIYNNISGNQRFNLNMTYTIDSLNSIIYTSMLNNQNGETENIDSVVDRVSKKSAYYVANDSRTANNSDAKGYNYNNNLIWRRKFNRKGRTISVNLINTIIKNQVNGYTAIKSRFYSSDQLMYRYRNTDYKISTSNQTNSYGVSLSYTEPISRNKILELNYYYSNNKNELDRKTYNYNNISKVYDELIDTLTNKFSSATTYNRVGTNFKGVNKKYNYQLGFAVQQTLLENRDLTKSIDLAQRYINLFPAASLNYQFTKSKSLQISYRGNNVTPAITQLQNITDVRAYPYVRKGNPNLQQEFVNNVMLTYNSFNVSRLQNLFVFVTYRTVHNKIVNSVEQKGGEQISMPVNSNGVYALTGNLNFGLPIKKINGSNFNTTTTLDYGRNASIINNSINYVRNLTLQEELSVNYNYDDKLDIGINGSITYNSINYALQKAQNSSYFTRSYSIDVSYTLPNDFIFSTSAYYTCYTGRSAGFNQNYIVWNASIAKQVFKNKKGEVRLIVDDILNQNRNVSRNVFDNYVEDVQNTTVKRFAMMMFVYKLNQLK